MKKIVTSLLLLAMTGGKAQAYETPTMGWSSWNAYGFKINEEIIKSQADALVSTGLKEAGYIYLNIDDGFFGGRDSSGKLLIHPTRFPNGMKTVVDYIHSKGLKAGIYSDAGRNTCASYFGGDTIGVGVGLYGHDQEDIDLYFKELDFDFIKVDFCGGSPGHNADKLDLPEKERYTAISQAIRNTGRTDVRLNVCRWAFPGTWVHDVATSWRVTEDIYLGWNSIKSIVGQNLYLSAYATEGKYNDMDMLEVGRGLSAEEDKTHFGMWCIMSSPLLIGCDMTAIAEESLALMTNAELIALNQDKLGLQAYVVDKVNGAYLLVKDVQQLYGNRRAVAVYNPTDSEVTRAVDFLALDLGGKVAVRDLFERRDIGTFAASMDVTVPAHGTRIYLLEAENRYERTKYEAETAWLSDYQELSNNQAAETGIYEEAGYCSGGAKAGWLGRKASNDLQWRSVYSNEGGDYDLTLSFITGETRKVYLQVNGGEAQVLELNSGGWSSVGKKEVRISLQKGNNTVRLYNSSGWMPDIDCMELVKANSLDVYRHQLEAARAKVKLLVERGVLDGLRLSLEKALEETAAVDDSKEAYQNAASRLQRAYDDAEKAMAVFPEIERLAGVCKGNAANSYESGAVTAMVQQADAAVAGGQAAPDASEMTALLNTLKADALAFHTSADANPIEGRQWDVTFMLANSTFDTDGSGWTSAPTVRSAVGEFWNTNFSMFQTIGTVKNGQYEVSVQALYRTGESDGGKAYRDGTETIPAKLHAGTASKPLASLYSYVLKGDEASFGDLDTKNGYANSMYAASVCFAKGEYWNTLAVTVGDNRLRVGLSNSGSKHDSWCCFDNFRVAYAGGDTTSAIESAAAPEQTAGDVYSIDGKLVRRNATAAEAVKGLRKGVYLQNGKKLIVR